MKRQGSFFRLKCVKGLIKIPGHYDNWKYMNSELKKKKKNYEKYNFKQELLSGRLQWGKQTIYY